MGLLLRPFSTAAADAFQVPAKAAWQARRVLNLVPGGRMDSRQSCAAAGGQRKVLFISARIRDGKDVYRQVVPFQPAAPKYVSLLADPSEVIAYLRIDLRSLQNRGAANLTLTMQYEQKVVETIEEKDLQAGRVRTFRVPVRNWPEGTLTGSYEIRAAGKQKALVKGRIEYRKEPVPEWYRIGKELGREEKVLPPWQPLEYDGTTVIAWGRRYDFDRSPIAEQIISQGQPLLRAPIRLEAVIDGQASSASVGSRSWQTAKGIRGFLRTKGKLGAFRIRLGTTIEFDGMVRFDLEMSADAAEHVEDLRLVIPFLPERSIYHHFAASYYARAGAGLVPDGKTALPFRPFLWLGDDDRGLMWFAESQQGWNCKPRPIEILKGRGKTEAIIHFVNQPGMVKSKLLTFGIQATPVKPLPPDYHTWKTERVFTPRLYRKHGIDWESKGIHINWRYLWWTDGMRRIFSPGHTTPLQVTGALGAEVEKQHAKGTPLLPYMYLYGVNRIATGYDRYYPAWQTSKPREMPYYGRVIMGACIGSTFSDYLLYGIDQWVKKFGIDGMYFDGAGPPVRCSNALHNHGWIDSGGRRRPVYPIFGLRDFYKRLWTILSNQVDRPIIWIHSDGKMPVPCFSFTTCNWEGEMVQGALKGGKTFLSDLLPLDYWRARLAGDAWGIVPMWLTTTYGTPEQRRGQLDDTLALLLVHGTPFSRMPMMDHEVVRRIWTFQEELDLGVAAFHPYWKNHALIRLAPENDQVVASFYRKGPHWALIVANFTHEDKEVTVTLADRPHPPDGPFTDVLHDVTVNTTNGEMGLTIPAKSFRLLKK